MSKAFFDDLKERGFGARPCPICGKSDWHIVQSPLAMLLVEPEDPPP